MLDDAVDITHYIVIFQASLAITATYTRSIVNGNLN